MPPIEVIPAFRALFIALVLGLLVGIQRQRSQSLVAGVRTFSLVTLLGTCCAMLASTASGPVGAAGMGDSVRREVSIARPEVERASDDAATGREGPEDGAGASEGARNQSGAGAGATEADVSPADAAAHAGVGGASSHSSSGEDTGDRSSNRREFVAWPIGPGAWIIAAGGLAIVSLAFLGNVLAMKRNESDPGMSTEVAMLVMYAVGALAWLAPMEVPAAIGVGVAVLLHAKDALHRFTARIGEKDVRAVLTFALITFIVLPVVPNETYGPFNVINPYEAWRMVALVVGMSLAGYVATKLFGRGGGAIIAGLMGGLVSSTATTAAAARQTKGDTADKNSDSGAIDATSSAASGSHRLDNLAATIILLATVVMYARVLTEIAVVTPANFAAIAPPIGVLAGVTLILGVIIWVRASRNPATIPEPENPTQLKPALFFALMYMAVIFVAAAAERYLGAGGLYAVAAISGLTDMDAITLSSARLVQDERLGADQAWRAVLIAATANMVFKAGMIATLGSRGLLRRIVALYAICGIVAVGLVIAWPLRGGG